VGRPPRLKGGRIQNGGEVSNDKKKSESEICVEARRRDMGIGFRFRGREEGVRTTNERDLNVKRCIHG